MLRKGIIDRFEADRAVVEQEDGSTVDVDRSLFPTEAKAGDVVIIHGNHVTIDQEATKKREAKIKKLMDDVWLD